MAREFVITTETNTDLSLSYLQENKIGVIPHYYTVEEEVYGGGRELTIQEFYQEMRNGKKVGTMASNPAVIAEVSPQSRILNTDSVSAVFSMISKIPCFITTPYASIVEIVSVVSSRTSKSTLTVSKAVKIVTLFSVAIRRI